MTGFIDEDDDLDEKHDINVTPFIDVMLVLLIIFMIAAPLATVDINVDLPASSGAASKRPDKPVWLTVNQDLTLALGNDPVAEGGLGAALSRATEDDPETRIFLRADRSVSYGDLMAVMNDIRNGGWTRIALVGLETDQAAPRQATDP